MSNNNSPAVAIVGAGLAGSEAALVLAGKGISVDLYEMRPERKTPAHNSALPAELVCSNSLKSEQLPTAHGLLKAELALLRSPLLGAARQNRVPAGSALAVDREKFSLTVRDLLTQSRMITMHCAEIVEPPTDRLCILAAGPLVSDSLSAWLQKTFSTDSLHFYDAIAPIIAADSVDMHTAFYAARYGKGEADYCNCPFTEQEYLQFYEALIAADKVKARDFENETFFEACLPVEVLAQRGYQALTFGPLKPVGFTDPRNGRRPFAVCQLRKENAAGESLNLVGFQTRMTVTEQKRVLRLIPGLANAEFLRYGSIHRNTYLQSPDLLRTNLSFRTENNLFCAGQLCGNEGYTESIVTGHLAALFVLAKIRNKIVSPPPSTTACGALLKHITASTSKPFTPSNINFGLLDTLTMIGVKRKNRSEKHQLLCDRALFDMRAWIEQNS